MKRLNWYLVIGTIIMSMLIGSQGTFAAQKQKTYNLKFQYFGPEVIPPGQWSKKAARRIEEKSNGRVKIKTYFSESLLKYDSTITGTASGIADISMVDPGVFTGMFQLNLVFSRLLADIPPSDVTTKAFRQLIIQRPELNEELGKKGIRWLSLFSVPGEYLHTTKQEIRVPGDIKGKKIALLGRDPAVWIQSIGGGPVQLPPGDWYMSLSRGLVDGQFVHWAAVDAFKLVEVFNYHTLFGEQGANLSFTGWAISQKTWKKLPKDLQDILIEAYNWAGDGIVENFNVEIGRAISDAKKKGNTFIKLTPEELQQWENTMKPINEQWIEETEQHGLPARETFNDLMALLEKYQKNKSEHWCKC